MQIYPGEPFDPPNTSILDQCIAEQKYVRGAQLRTLIYAHVSISGQALVFVTRTVKHSFLDRAGGLTYIAFICAQVRGRRGKDGLGGWTNRRWWGVTMASAVGI